MTFNFQEIEHMLKNFSLLPPESLAAVTDEDLETYAQQYDVYNEKTKEDVAKRNEMMVAGRGSINTLYGSGSNAARYFHRHTNDNSDLVSKHARKYVLPNVVEQSVIDSREKYTLVSTPVNVDDLTMESIDECISYLLRKEFVFGRDFNAHNAIDLARGVMKDDVVEAVANNTLSDVVCLDSNSKVADFCFENSNFSNV